MKISEVIKKLQVIKERRGDKPICLYNYEVPTLSYLKDKDIIFIM